MHATRPRSPRHLGISWLVWLALLLPAAQSAATWHGYSHTGSDVSRHEPDKQSQHVTHCDLCLTAAAVSGGGLVDDQPALSVRGARHELPEPDVVGIWPAFPTLAYLSRAPPPAPR